MNDTIPAGWSYNPSSWRHRIPVIALSAINVLISLYLASNQMHLVPAVWDPIFGYTTGSEQVLHSWISSLFPVPDAGLGALAYLIEAVLGFIGGNNRWRAKPWTAVSFGFLTLPLAGMSIILVSLQAFVIKAWCTLCLAVALISFLILALAIGEAISSVRFLLESVRQGKTFWQTLMNGDK